MTEIECPIVNAVFAYLTDKNPKFPPDKTDYKNVVAKKIYDNFYRLNFYGFSDKIVDSLWVEYTTEEGVKSATRG